MGADLKGSNLEVVFPTGMRMKFAHLEHEKNMYDWDGSQVAFLGFDELTSFTERQFFYLLSRNRSTSGVPGYIRATCNPDADSWVRHFIDWWIDNDTGLPIPERSGKLRWFVRVNDKMIWADSKEALLKEYGDHLLPKSVTFIPAKLQDNKILMDKDPGYLANLEALPRVERMRLLEGNWNVRPQSGLYFKAHYFEIVQSVPARCQAIRYWDRASTEPSENNRNPDWTAGVKLLKADNGLFYVEHVVHMRGSPSKVEDAILNTARQDGTGTTVFLEQDPGSAGVAEIANLSRLLSGFIVKTNKPTTDKITRAGPVSAQCERGNVKLLQAPWNKDFLTELESFPDGAHDDIVDSFSGNYNMHTLYNVGSFTEKHIPNRVRNIGGGLKW